ncbi:MAG: hypothetical protein V1644_03305 [Candidatus Micrarchaeota archaeon]
MSLEEVHQQIRTELGKRIIKISTPESGGRGTHKPYTKSFSLTLRGHVTKADIRNIAQKAGLQIETKQVAENTYFNLYDPRLAGENAWIKAHRLFGRSQLKQEIDYSWKMTVCVNSSKKGRETLIIINHDPTVNFNLTPKQGSVDEKLKAVSAQIEERLKGSDSRLADDHKGKIVEIVKQLAAKRRLGWRDALVEKIKIKWSRKTND